MSKLHITTYPSPILREGSKPIPISELPKYKNLIKEMVSFMKEKDGLGLAAPQIGQNIQLAIVSTNDGAIALINPKIIKKSWKKENGEEGCLSLPSIFGMVKRHSKISVLTFSQAGKEITFTAKGLFARVIQHEIDHLNGILFIDRTKKITQGKDELEKLEKDVKNKK